MNISTKDFKYIANELAGCTSLFDSDEGKIIVIGDLETFTKIHAEITEQWNNEEIPDGEFYQAVEDRLPKEIGFIL